MGEGPAIREHKDVVRSDWARVGTPGRLERGRIGPIRADGLGGHGSMGGGSGNIDDPNMGPGTAKG